jgi:hypothetical protein
MGSFATRLSPSRRRERRPRGHGGRGWALFSAATVLTVAVAALVFAVGPSLAATQGSLGSTSTGTAVISLSKGFNALINQIGDLALGSWSGTGDLTDNDDVCVGTTNVTGNYGVTVSGSGTANAFTITNGSQTLAYNAFWNDVTGTTGRVSVTTGTLLTGQTGAGTTANCNGTNTNANISVVIPEANLQAATASTFTGTLTLTISPE